MFWVHWTDSCCLLRTWGVTTETSCLGCRSQLVHFFILLLDNLFESWEFPLCPLLCLQAVTESWMDRCRFWNFLLVDCCAQSTLIHQQKEIEWKWSTCQSGPASHRLAGFCLISLCLMPATNLQARLAMVTAQWAWILKPLWHDVLSARVVATKTRNWANGAGCHRCRDYDSGALVE